MPTPVAGNTLTVSAPGVLANDTNADGGTLTATLGTTVSHGSLTLNCERLLQLYADRRLLRHG